MVVNVYFLRYRNFDVEPKVKGLSMCIKRRVQVIRHIVLEGSKLLIIFNDVIYVTLNPNVNFGILTLSFRENRI